MHIAGNKVLMIYLADKKILFLKAKKVAGTSFEIALSRYSTNPEADIITPIMVADELIRVRQSGRLPVNWASNKYVEE